MAEESRRRLAAILAADVAGYSRLVGADEEGTLAALRAHRAELIDDFIRSHGGRIANTAGDSMLLEFPSAADAVKCIVAVQQGMAERNGDIDPERRIRFGINVGDVVAEGEDLLGDGVNIAARVEGLSEPGGLAISDDAHRQVRDRLDIPWRDGGAHEVKNIARPVHVWHWRPATSVREATSQDTVAMASALSSIAVLPFANMSGDVEQEYFADGIAEDVITALSRVSRLRVIARNWSFAYKGLSPDIRRVAEELGVRYVLEGSVRSGGNRIRVTAQLIDATDGGHLWAERYDRKVDDVFEIQDQIVKEIVTNLRLRLTDGEQALMFSRGTDNIEAWQQCLRVVDQYMKHDASGHLRAREHAERAVALDPGYAAAWAVLGYTYWFEGRMASTETAPAKFERLRELADRAMSLDDKNPATIGVSTLAGISNRRHDESVAIAEGGLVHLPGNADARGFLALALLHAGRYKEALAHFDASFALNPLPPTWYRNGHARALLCFERFDDALAATDRLLEIEPDFHQAWLYRAYIFQRLGRTEDARAAMTRASQLAPLFRARHIRQFFLLKDLEMLKRFAEVLAAAGLPA